MTFLFMSILTGIGLSMDAFSLSILYGTLNISKKKILILSSIVGAYHFFMPLFGNIIGDNVLSRFILDSEILIGIIFAVIAIQMLLSLRKEEEVKKLTGLSSLLLFGLTVSIDSLTVGIGFGTITIPFYYIIFSAIIFSFTSFLFTFLGLNIGKTLGKKFDKIAILIGSILLLGLSIYHFLL